MRKACILGGSLSGLELARRLADAGIDVHLFRRLHDPSRSFRDLHPVYEYCPRVLPVPESAGLLSAAVESWCAAELLENDNAAVGTVLSNGPHRVGEFKAGPSVRRVRSANAGFFGFLDALAERLPDKAFDRHEILAGLAKSEKCWTPVDLEGNALGSFDLLICSYDYFLRGTRKAAVRALLESVLPASAPVMRAVAGSVDCCAFALPVAVHAAKDLRFDVAHIRNVPELAIAIRNERDGHEKRGLPAEESWMLIATPEWTDSIRPDATSRWDKNDVAKRMLNAFTRLFGLGAGRALRPPYHWGGFASLTRSSSSPFAFDANNGLAFVGDFFEGHGANECLVSAAGLAEHLVDDITTSILPGGEDWTQRIVSNGAEEVSTLLGSAAATEDHSWPTFDQLRSGTLPRGQRCMDRYRRRRIYEQDLQWLRSQGSGDGPEQSNVRSSSSAKQQSRRKRWERKPAQAGYRPEQDE